MKLIAIESIEFSSFDHGRRTQTQLVNNKKKKKKSFMKWVRFSIFHYCENKNALTHLEMDSTRILLIRLVKVTKI